MVVIESKMSFEQVQGKELAMFEGIPSSNPIATEAEGKSKKNPHYY